MRGIFRTISAERPLLIAGPTASGKSDLALEVQAQQGGTIVNADALQVFAAWRILTARPSAEDEARVPHALYGHVPRDHVYSVGAWLREVTPLLTQTRPIIVGGTGLYFTALTQGLAEIPPIPDAVRSEAMTLAPDEMRAMLDAETAAQIDLANPMRVQRAWEVQRATGRGLAAWQADTPAPRLPLEPGQALVLDADRDWLADRIDRRFDAMVAAGALDEAQANLSNWQPDLPAAKAIGASQLIDVVRGDRDLKDAVKASKALTRQYAKRQRTWFRSKMHEWRAILLP